MSDFSERVAASLMSLDGEVMDFSLFYSAEDSRGRFAPRLRIGEVAEGMRFWWGGLGVVSGCVLMVLWLVVRVSF